MITDNDRLRNIDGLSNLVFAGQRLSISNNQNLSDCCGIQDLLAVGLGPSFVRVNANRIGCNSNREIVETPWELDFVSVVVPPCVDVDNGEIQVFATVFDTGPLRYSWLRDEDGMTGSGSSQSDNFSISMLGVGTL